jgi:hypothetical protein
MSPRLADGFRNLVQQTEFPCLGAKSALAKGTLEILIARDIKSNWDDRRIYDGRHHSHSASVPKGSSPVSEFCRHFLGSC